MYAFQFQDGTWRIDLMTSSKEPWPAYGTIEQKLFHGVYNTERDANQAIAHIRARRLPTAPVYAVEGWEEF